MSGVHALRDVPRLLVIRDEHRATAIVDAVFRVVVTDALDGVTRDLDVVDVGLRGDFARQYDKARIAERFGRDTRILVLRQDGVEDGVGDLIGDLVRVAFGDGFRGKEIIV